jgi:hypothetical protein
LVFLSIAVQYAQGVVKASLADPSTATFPGTFLEPLTDTLTIPGEDCTWSIQSYVDEKNSLGAKIRTYWLVKLLKVALNHLGDPEWHVLDLQTNPSLENLNATPDTPLPEQRQNILHK